MNQPLRIDGVEDPDIVRVILDRVSALIPEAQRVHLAEVEQEVRTQYGGLRVRIPKRKKHMSEGQRQQLVAEALTASAASDADISNRFGIHRATLYRMIKKGRGGPG